MISKFSKLPSKFSPNLIKILKNTAWLFADNILRMFSGLIVGVWVARYLQPEQYGNYNYCIAFVSLFGAVASLGLNQIVIRDIVREPSEKNQLLGTAFVLKLLGGIVALILSVGMISILRPGDNLSLWMVGITALSMTFNSFEVIDFWFQSQVQSKHTVLAKNLALALSCVVKISLINSQAPLIAFAVVYAGEFALVAVGLVTVYHLQGNLMTAWKYRLDYAIRLLKDSWTLILSGFMIMIYMRIDQIMLGEMVGDKAVGIYSAAVRVSELWMFIPIAISNSVFPSIIEAKKISENLYYERLQKLFSSMSFLSYVVAIGISLFAGQIIQLLFGAGYEAASSILIVHIWMGVFMCLGVVRSLWTTTEGLMRFAFITAGIGGLINILLNLLLIGKYGGLGAAIATVIAQASADYIASGLFPQTRKIFIVQTKALFTPNPQILFRKK
ncbi:MAG: flippase [Scytonematopsis contorta HA4267-MV1]|jgi:PST family polysaccharide transporter|nr:flippase [Scytonematopsis contorta HA4267-MV1]